ncbi:hypothetical protein LU293_04130 [Moraxella nasovis]|uniref:GA-like domain-containing protein n=1 Tax=Moraxella nasovis TaxID=2904121 RepID=UPI001F605DC1|nr:hypothetical protein [Moraxella nasovis]UNU74090.1 hypothetical protein LU293_04130 [Moraxella nasovis]
MKPTISSVLQLITTHIIEIKELLTKIDNKLNKLPSNTETTTSTDKTVGIDDIEKKIAEINEKIDANYGENKARLDGLDKLMARALRTVALTEKQRDADNDRITDYDEYEKYGTNPDNKDTDNDGYSDYSEVMEHSDHKDETSTPSYPIADDWHITAKKRDDGILQFYLHLTYQGEPVIAPKVNLKDFIGRVIAINDHSDVTINFNEDTVITPDGAVLLNLDDAFSKGLHEFVFKFKDRTGKHDMPAGLFSSKYYTAKEDANEVRLVLDSIPESTETRVKAAEQALQIAYNKRQEIDKYKIISQKDVDELIALNDKVTQAKLTAAAAVKILPEDITTITKGITKAMLENRLSVIKLVEVPAVTDALEVEGFE